jgi:hypothetical protein
MSASKLQKLQDASRGDDGPTRFLTFEGLVETVGTDTPLDEITDLEILFLTFDEITDNVHTRNTSQQIQNPSVFSHLPNLKRLALLDNSLKHISGFEAISLSLVNLTICDQPLSDIR